MFKKIIFISLPSSFLFFLILFCGRVKEYGKPLYTIVLYFIKIFSGSCNYLIVYNLENVSLQIHKVSLFLYMIVT